MSNKELALIIDDSSLNRDILKEMLNDEFYFLEAKNGIEGLSLAKEYNNKISVVFLDLIMPELSGMDVLESLELTGLTRRFPIFIITADDKPEIENECLSHGAFDFVRKPFNMTVVKHRVYNAVSLYSYKNSLEDKIREQTEKIISQYNELQESAEAIQRRSDRLVEFLSNLVEARDVESGNHVRNVCNITIMIAQELARLYPEYDFDTKYITMLGQVSMLHDIGKISIPDSILLKAGKLTDEEYEEMKKHTVYGEKILDKAKSIWDDEDMVELSKEIARHHHERWDGKGYPDELRGDDIPIESQIVSLADCFEALIVDRVYRKAVSKKKAINMIMKGDCGRFNPQLLVVLKEIEHKL